MMSKQDRQILDEFSSRLRRRFQGARIWAFGSRARGDAAWDSDFDICIVLDQVDQKTEQWIRDIAWEVSFEKECVITTVVLDADEFENGPMSESTLVANVAREGVPS